MLIFAIFLVLIALTAFITCSICLRRRQEEGG